MDIDAQIEEVVSNYDELTYDKVRNCIAGDLLLPDGDSYEVEIDITPYPFLFPTVFEMGERIPKKADRHVFEVGGHCCFMPRAKSQVYLKTSIKTLKLFIDEIVVPYFQNNSYYELNGKYKTQEYSHDKHFGVTEGYQDILQVKSIYTIIEVVKNRIAGIEYGRRRVCYCGSGERLKNCSSGRHERGLEDLKLIDNQVLKSDLQTMQELIKMIEHYEKARKVS